MSGSDADLLWSDDRVDQGNGCRWFAKNGYAGHERVRVAERLFELFRSDDTAFEWTDYVARYAIEACAALCPPPDGWIDAALDAWVDHYRKTKPDQNPCEYMLGDLLRIVPVTAVVDGLRTRLDGPRKMWVEAFTALLVTNWYQTPGLAKTLLSCEDPAARQFTMLELLRCLDTQAQFDIDEVLGVHAKINKDLGGRFDLAELESETRAKQDAAIARLESLTADAPDAFRTEALRLNHERLETTESGLWRV